MKQLAVEDIDTKHSALSQLLVKSSFVKWSLQRFDLNGLQTNYHDGHVAWGFLVHHSSVR